MPFINGRYHMNPAMGQALEDARAAADALLESDDGSHSAPPEDDFAAPSHDATDNKGPIHHVEIEAAEVVPSHTGRATHGFVARIHRVAAPRSAGVSPANFPDAHSDQNRRPDAGATPLRPETHVFADHRDLLDFLRTELAKEGLPGPRQGEPGR
jgi:hypothetical protein